MVVGGIEFGDGDGVYLHDDGTWRSETRPATAEILTIIHANTFDEDRGGRGMWQIDDAAGIMGGEAVFAGDKEESTSI